MWQFRQILWYAVILCLTVQLQESSLYSGYWETNQRVSTSVCSPNGPNVWEPQHIKHVAKDFPGKAWSREVKRKHWKSSLWPCFFVLCPRSICNEFAMKHNESQWITMNQLEKSSKKHLGRRPQTVAWTGLSTDEEEPKWTSCCNGINESMCEKPLRVDSVRTQWWMNRG